MSSDEHIHVPDDLGWTPEHGGLVEAAGRIVGYDPSGDLVSVEVTGKQGDYEMRAQMTGRIVEVVDEPGDYHALVEFVGGECNGQRLAVQLERLGEEPTA
jgi:hypothetical protein